jgi:hypothetical protein
MTDRIRGFDKPLGHARTQSDKAGQETQPTPRATPARAVLRTQARTEDFQQGTIYEVKYRDDGGVDYQEVPVEIWDEEMFDGGSGEKLPENLKPENLTGEEVASPRVKDLIKQFEEEALPEKPPTITTMKAAPATTTTTTTTTTATTTETQPAPVLSEKEKTPIISKFAKKITNHSKHKRSGSSDVEPKEKKSVVSKLKDASKHKRAGSAGVSSPAKERPKVPALNIPAPQSTVLPSPRTAWTPVQPKSARKLLNDLPPQQQVQEEKNVQTPRPAWSGAQPSARKAEQSEQKQQPREKVDYDDLPPLLTAEDLVNPQVVSPKGGNKKS